MCFCAAWKLFKKCFCIKKSKSWNVYHDRDETEFVHLDGHAIKSGFKKKFEAMKAVDSALQVSIISDCKETKALPATNVFLPNSPDKMVPKTEVKSECGDNENKPNGIAVNGTVHNGTCDRGDVSPKHFKIEGCNKITGQDQIIRTSLTLGLIGGYKGEDESSNEKHSLESLGDDLPANGTGLTFATPPENIPRLQDFELHGDSGLESAASSWDRTVAEVKEHAFARLQEELRKAHQELKLKDEEVNRLSRIRLEVESELEELTASLFQEAHNMVKEANIKQASADRALRESVMQVEVLTAEVAALKTLVLTSTPSRPNPHLHPQIDPKGKEESPGSGTGLFRKHRRSPSHFNLKYGRENSPPDSPVKDQRPVPPAEPVETKDGLEVDPILHKEFLAWRQNPSLDKTDPFIARMYKEDIDCCLAFTNTQLAEQVRSAIESGSIFIEAVSDKTKTHFPKKCALLETPRQCHYRMRLGDSETWHSISQICRNRIIAVCDFLNYLNYIQKGLVKSSVHEIYWEIIRLRKEIFLVRLGLALTT